MSGDAAREALAELAAVLDTLELCPVCALDADEHGDHDDRLHQARARAKAVLAN